MIECFLLYRKRDGYSQKQTYWCNYKLEYFLVVFGDLS